MSAGKGSGRRPGDGYGDGWDRIFKRAKDAPKPTGWDNHLNQDCDKKLGTWFADRMGAREQLVEVFDKKEDGK